MNLFPAYNAEAHLKQVQKQWKIYRLNSIDMCRKATEEIQKAYGGPLRLPIDDIFYGDLIYHTVEPKMASRAYLTVLEHQLTQERINSAADVIEKIFDSIEYPTGQSSLTVPLYTRIPDFRRYVSAIIVLIMNAEYNGHKTFPSLNQKLRDNVFFASGIDPERPGSKKFVMPDEYDGSPLDYLRNTPFYDFFQQGVPFSLTKWNLHGIAIGPSGHGKSQLLQSFIKDRLTEPEPIGFWFMDPHGDSFDTVKDRVPPERLVVIDPDDPKHRPSLNFLDFQNSTEPQARQTFEYLMSSLSGSLSDKQGAIVPYLLKLLRNIPGASLETLRLIVDEKVKVVSKSQFFPAISALPTVDQGFFHNQFYSGRMQETKDAIGWRIYSAMSSEAFREMFGSSDKSSLNFDDLIEQRKVVVIRGGRQSLGDDGMRIFLQFMLAQYFAAALRRERIPKHLRHLNIMFVDEGSFVLSSPVIASMCFELRKYECALWIATQVYEQIGPEVRAAILGSVGTKICGPVSFSDANVLGREMNVGAEFIRSMKAVPRSHADWAIFETGMDRAIKVSVPYGQLEAMPRHIPLHEKAAKLNETPEFKAVEKLAEQETALQKNLGSMIFDLVKDKLGLTPQEKETLKTHEAPARTEASRGDLSKPAEADGLNKPSVPQEERAARERKAAETPEVIITPPPRRDEPKKPELSDIELVVSTARRLETMLEVHYGGMGRGLHSLLNSVETKFPPQLAHHVRFIASMRNQVLHKDGFALPDRPQFLQYAQKLYNHFAALEKHSTQYDDDPSKPVPD